jgi:hypothetical protein
VFPTYNNFLKGHVRPKLPSPWRTQRKRRAASDHDTSEPTLLYVLWVRAGIAQSVKRLATGWTVQGSNPGWGRDFPQPSRPAQETTQPHVGYRVSFAGVKRPGRGVHHTPRSSADVKERAELPWCPHDVFQCELNLPRHVWCVPRNYSTACPQLAYDGSFFFRSELSANKKGPFSTPVL